MSKRDMFLKKLENVDENLKQALADLEQAARVASHVYELVGEVSQKELEPLRSAARRLEELYREG